MATHIYIWNEHSNGGGNLAAALGVKKIKHEHSAFKGSKSRVVINWGAGELPHEVLKSTVLNSPEAIKRCANKLTFFNFIAGKGVSIPDWTTDSQVALEWIRAGHKVCARKVLNGHSAAGLVIMSPDDPNSFTKAPLYTKYMPKKEEYRVHVVRGRVIDVQKKALRPGYIDENPNPNWHIRNLANGFIYVRGNVDPPKCVLDEAIRTIQVVGLDFGAVDVVYQQKKERAYVLEVNTAPGLEGTTVDNYAEAIRRI